MISLEMCERLNINSLWPSDSIWWHWAGSALYCLNQCCLTTSEDLHLRAISQEMSKISILNMTLNVTILRLQLHFSGANGSTIHVIKDTTPITRFMGPTWGPPGSCRPQMGPMLAPWSLLSGYIMLHISNATCDLNHLVYLLLFRSWCISW